jgi:hypothetical protein
LLLRREGGAATKPNGVAAGTTRATRNRRFVVRFAVFLIFVVFYCRVRHGD